MTKKKKSNLSSASTYYNYHGKAYFLASWLAGWLASLLFCLVLINLNFMASS